MTYESPVGNRLTRSVSVFGLAKQTLLDVQTFIKAAIRGLLNKLETLNAPNLGAQLAFVCRECMSKLCVHLVEDIYRLSVGLVYLRSPLWCDTAPTPTQCNCFQDTM